MQEQYHPEYSNSKQYFFNIPKNQRGNYLQKILETKQNPNPPPKIFSKQFTSSAKFKYQNCQLHYYQIENTHQPKTIILHFHGLNSHGKASAYYANIICDYNKEVNAYAFDQMNFGLSEGPTKGFISSLDDCVKQGETFIEYLLQRFEKKPKIFLSGSSFGGTIVFKMSVKPSFKYDGLILLAPAIRDLKQSKPFLKKFNNILAWIAPKMRIPLPISSKDSTKCNCDQYIKKDESYFKQAVPGSISTVLSAMQQVSKLYQQLSIPYIAFQGGNDKSVDLFAVVDLQLQSKSKDKQTIYYSKMWHSVFYEEEIQDISFLASRWISKRL